MANLQTSTSHSSIDTPSTSTSTSTHYPNSYFDVFISHRGPDVKNTFATHLYRELRANGLQSFLDREELQAGELLSPQIEEAISVAYIHIIIFSPGYADSRWCLDELRLILNKSGDTIIPVFYKVKPSELRWAGQYAEALSNHEQKGRYNSQTVESWRKALKDVSDRVGFELEAYNGDEGRLLENVLQCVLKNRRKVGFNVAKYPTGLQQKVREFENTLSLQQRQSGKVKVMGIVGMGGAGKTTLAKELFNKKFSNFGVSSFLFDVRLNGGRRSLNSLQTKLIKDLAHRDVQIDNVDGGIEILKTYVDSKHALVVLDDVDAADQLDALFLPIMEVLRSDSLILVTSRYKDVLASSGIAESSMYKLTGLREQHSQQLFCSYAFCHPRPPPGFEYLVVEFCRACQGLPLSLKVFGGLLCEKENKSYWEGLLDRLRQIKLPNEIQQTLKLSYDALEEEEKQIFLDIACFFIGEDRDMAIRIWDGSGWNGLVGLVNLESRCLVEVDRENNTIKMHDHLRDMGRGIADQKYSSEVTWHRHRLWRLTEDIHELWKQSTVRRDEVLGTTPYRFRNLQLVATQGLDLESILRSVESPNLIWLRWNNCPFSYLPSWIPMKNIRVLQVGGNKLKTLWRAESQASLELRELYIAAPLFQFPKFIGQLKHIEKIVVMQSNIESLPEEFCLLRGLKYLLLRCAYSLKSLPDSFGCLTNLQHLDLGHCASLRQLPDSSRCLTNLQHLDLQLRQLPDSFGCLTNLQHLKLQLRSGQLPDSFGCLTNLQHLDLSWCESLQGLPDSFGCLTNLQHLNLCKNLRQLPDSFGCLTNLQHLNLQKCQSLRQLPDSFRCLTNLQHLNLYDCASLLQLPDSFGCLTNLQHLDLEWCNNLRQLPDSFGCLTNLQHLDLEWCNNLRQLPDSFGCLTNLQHLNLQKCFNLQQLPDSFGCLTNLQHLDLEWCNNLRQLPDSFGCLTNLQHLNLQKCFNLQQLPDSFGCLTNLQHLDLRWCASLRQLPDSFRCLTNLQHLDLQGCKSLQQFPYSFSCLTSLQHLHL